MIISIIMQVIVYGKLVGGKLSCMESSSGLTAQPLAAWRSLRR